MKRELLTVAIAATLLGANPVLARGGGMGGGGGFGTSGGHSTGDWDGGMRSRNEHSVRTELGRQSGDNPSRTRTQTRTRSEGAASAQGPYAEGAQPRTRSRHELRVGERSGSGEMLRREERVRLGE